MTISQQPNASNEQQTTKFNFFQNWYPLTPLEDLDPKKPTPVSILGMRLVIWKPIYSETYRVFLDLCPHRLAPLSEGRIEEKNGNLICSYHGWEFDRSGICQKIPQAEKQTLLEENKEQFCVKVFPTQEVNGLLWVWPDLETAELSHSTPLPLSPQIDRTKGFVWTSIVRDLAYDWEVLVENVADPAHVPFAHHGVQGNREQAVPIPIEIVNSTADLIAAKIDRNLPTSITFQPPCRLEYSISIGNTGKQFGLVVYCIPVSPGKSRVVAQFPRNFAKNLHKITPRWWDHTFDRNLVLDGDTILLQQQYAYLKQKKEGWKTAYQMPTSADRLVIEFRKWFDRYCGGKLPWNEANNNISASYIINENRQEMLDRYNQHTKNCSSCRGALKNIKRIKIVLLAYFVLAVSSVAVFPDNIRINWGLPIISIALFALIIYGLLKYWLEPKFYFVDYVHPEKD